MLHKSNEICSGKIRYSKKEAKLKRVENLKFKNPDLRIYQCPMCFDYHLTSSFEHPVKLERSYQPKKIRKKRYYHEPSYTLDS